MRIKRKLVNISDKMEPTVNNGDITAYDSLEKINDTVNQVPVNAGIDSAAIINSDAETTKELNANQLQQIAALNMVAESFNPMLDRIRNMVKEIPKSGDSNVDSQVRSLMNYLLQTRLPDNNNNLAQIVKAEEIKFTQRLSNSYPSLTKNDIRIA